jgi:hypothetical protein
MTGELLQNSSVVFTKGVAQSGAQALNSFLGSEDFLIFVGLILVVLIGFWLFKKARRR